MRVSPLRPASRAAAVLAVVLAVSSLTASPASASTVIGSTFLPTSSCGAPYTIIQTTNPPGVSYTVAAPGVITSWRFQSAASAPHLKFKVFRPVGGTSYTVIGSSDEVIPILNTIDSYNIRIPVQAGDIIGETTLTSATCSSGGGGVSFVAGDVGVGSTATYDSSGMGVYDLAAVLEADADGDGYGDESQDACLSQASAGAACDVTAPDTTITAGKKTSRSGKVKYKFTTSEAGASFECKLTGAKKKLATFRACTSPARYKHLKPGKYKFYVRSIDPFGNVDATPAKKKVKVLPKG
jgi:hypothetical protein